MGPLPKANEGLQKTRDKPCKWAACLSDSHPPAEARSVVLPPAEWQDPVSQQIFYARSYGHECLFYTPPGGPGLVRSHRDHILAPILQCAQFDCT